MTNITGVLSQAIYGKLSTTSGLTALLSKTTAIFHAEAPATAELPYVIFDIIGGGDENRSNHRTQNLVLWIRGYTSVSALSAGAIDAQIDEALHMGSITVTGWTKIWLVRERTIPLAPEILGDGTRIYGVGGHYRLRIEKT